MIKLVFTHYRHAEFVREWLSQNVGANVEVASVSDPAVLKGIPTKETYVRVMDIDKRTDRESDAIGEVAYRQGFNILTIDDSARR